jgi:hypothetical protein
LFARAVPWRYLAINSAELVAAPSPASAPDPPTPQEATALLNDAWRDPKWGLLLRLNMATAHRAMALLQAEGLIRAQRGQRAAAVRPI